MPAYCASAGERSTPVSPRRSKASSRKWPRPSRNWSHTTTPRAGLAAPAIDYYRRAAERAMAASANAEAIAHLTKGLELIDSLPESAERISREIDFRLALGTPLIAKQGWASVEAQAAYTRAKELCADAGETPELFRSLVGLWVYHLVQPDMETASELSRELFNLAAKLGSDRVPFARRTRRLRHLLLVRTVHNGPVSRRSGARSCTTRSATAGWQRFGWQTQP